MRLRLVVPPDVGGMDLCSANGRRSVHERRVLPHDLVCLVLELAQPLLKVTHLSALMRDISVFVSISFILRSLLI